MNSKVYKLPNGKRAVFEYDIVGVGKITLECMDELMSMIADRPQGEWIEKAISIIDDMQSEGIVDYEQAREFRMRARMKGADDDR